MTAALMKRDKMDTAAEKALTRVATRNDRIVFGFHVLTTTVVMTLPCAMIAQHGSLLDPMPGGRCGRECLIAGFIRIELHGQCHLFPRMTLFHAVNQCGIGSPVRMGADHAFAD